MSRRAWQRLVGGGLVGLLVLAIAALLANWHVERAYRHVVVEVFNVNDVVRVSVNCERALAVPASAGPERIDLGWLSPDDRVSISDFNETGNAAWGVRIISNGEVEFEQQRGQANLAGFRAGEYAVVMAQSFTAAGDPLGAIGCGPPLLVAGLPNYQRSPDDHKVETTDGARDRWQSPTFPFALIGFSADWSLLVLAVAGFVAAIGVAQVRDLIRRHWRLSLLVAFLNLIFNLWRQFGVEGLLLCGEGVGVILLLLTAVVALWPHTGPPCLTSSSTPSQDPG